MWICQLLRICILQQKKKVVASIAVLVHEKKIETSFNFWTTNIFYGFFIWKSLSLSLSPSLFLSLWLPCSFQGRCCMRMRGRSIVSGIFCGCWWLCGQLGGSLPERGDSEQQGPHTGSPRTLWKDVSSVLKSWKLIIIAWRHYVMNI